jgi:CheY-like chemotaxis protein
VSVGVARAASLGVAAGDYVELAVADTGTGIEPAVIDRIFEPFWSTKAAEGRGAGLGLATVYGIVQQSRGVISVQSEVGKGSCFTILLPKAAEVAAPAAAAAPVRRQGAEESVLVVEDDDSIRWLVERALRNAGYRVHVAPNAAAALALHSQLPEDIALLFTDVVMPGTNGPELARRLLEVRPGLKVLFTSGYANDRAFDAATLPLGAHFLPKPYSVAALTEKVRDVLDR